MSFYDDIDLKYTETVILMTTCNKFNPRIQTFYLQSLVPADSKSNKIVSEITEDELKATITFDLTIKTESGKEYKSNLSFDMPVEGVVENGTAAKEITDLSNIIFKRTKN